LQTSKAVCCASLLKIHECFELRKHPAVITKFNNFSSLPQIRGTITQNSSMSIFIS